MHFPISWSILLLILSTRPDLPSSQKKSFTPREAVTSFFDGQTLLSECHWWIRAKKNFLSFFRSSTQSRVFRLLLFDVWGKKQFLLQRTSQKLFLRDRKVRFWGRIVTWESRCHIRFAFCTNVLDVRNI